MADDEDPVLTAARAMVYAHETLDPSDVAEERAELLRVVFAEDGFDWIARLIRTATALERNR